MNLWNEIKAAWGEVRAGAEEWQREGFMLGASMREATFGAMRFASACFAWTGFVLTDLAMEAEHGLVRQKKNPRNASVAAGAWEVRQ